MIIHKDLENSWRLFWGVSFVMLALTLWPLIAYEYPAMPDYANHLSRLQMLTGYAHEGWQKYYYINHEIVPNLALDLIAHSFVKIGFTPEIALRLFTGLTLLILIAGTYSVAWVINRRPPWLAIWAFIFAFNRYFTWGFLNYFFSLGVGFLLFAGWIYVRNNQRINEPKIKLLFYSTTSLLLLFVLLSHLMGYGLTLIFIFMYEFCRCLQVQFSLKKIINHLSKVVLVFVPSLLFYVFVCVHGANHDVLFLDFFRSKVSALFGTFFSYNVFLTFVYIFAFLLTIRLMTNRLEGFKQIITKLYPSKLYLIPLSIFMLFLVLPSAMMGSYFLDKRILVVVMFLILAVTVFDVNEKKLLLIIVIMITAHLIKVIEVSHHWSKHSIAMHQISQALDKIELQSTIEGFAFGDDEKMPTPPLQHAVTLAISQRAAFVPTLFAFPINLESVGFKKPYDKEAYSTGTFSYQRSLKWMAHECENHFQYVLVTYMKYKPEVPSCLMPIAEGDYFVLYRLKGKPAPIK